MNSIPLKDLLQQYVLAASTNPSPNEIRAKRVFDAWMNCPYDSEDEEVFENWERDFDTLITNDLDCNSIAYFIQLITKNGDQTSRAATARKAAFASHEKNRIDKQTVFTWCDSNMSRFSSMDEAALDIAESFVPQKFRTVRTWMTEWKKLRSASSP